MSLNRVTLLTAPGTSAIAVVRLAGPGVEPFLGLRFSRPVPFGRCVHGFLRDGDRVIDDAIAVRSADWVDLNLHGGSWVVRSAIDLAERDGFAILDSIESDGHTEVWREVMNALPLAKTEQAVRILLAQPAVWESLPSDPGAIRQILADQGGRWLISTPTIAIVGPANVGKSTLANQLFGQSRSITADLPGTTRDWVGEIANIDGLAIMLLDTPGQRITDDPIEQAAIGGSKPMIRSADLVLLVLDQSLPMDTVMIASHPGAILIANKSDAKHQWEASSIDAIQTVAFDGRGMDKLRAAIRQRLGFESMETDTLRWWTPRQREVLQSLVT